MAISILWNGITYSIPETGDESWGENLTSFFVALPQGALQKTGGNFTLTANANFGASFGLLSAYFSTRTALPSTAGLFRLALADTIGWRNNANDGNLLLAINGSDQLTFNGTAIYPAGITALTGDVTATGPGSVAATIANSAVTNAKMANMDTGTAKANISGGAAAPSDIALVSAATASAIMIRDANANSRLNALIENFATTATAAGTTTLTVASAKNQQFTGSTTQTVALPDATTLVIGRQFVVLNRSSGDVTVNDGAAGLVVTVPGDSQAILTVTAIGSAAGTWDFSLSANGAGTGTVTSVAMTVPTALFAASPVSGSPVTTTGTLAPALATQTANTVFAGPTSGGAATPTFRALVSADQPNGNPPGSVIMYGGASAPTGWLLCDGSAVSRSTYADLYAVVSTTYGVGDGSTTFNVPDARGVFVRGTGSQTISSIGYTGTRGTTQGDQFQGHYHTFPLTGIVRYGFANVYNLVAGSNGDVVNPTVTDPITDGSNGTPRKGAETRPANIVLTYIIKT